jgi:hypothetical protein
MGKWKNVLRTELRFERQEFRVKDEENYKKDYSKIYVTIMERNQSLEEKIVLYIQKKEIHQD